LNYRAPIRDYILLALLAGCVSVTSFAYYFRTEQVLLYGDAVAHINIARRVFDSRDPGPLQLGTVWLPLPHVLMMPLVISDWSWRTGFGGSLPSMIAYVLGVLGVFRLVKRGLSRLAPGRQGSAHLAAWFAAGVYGANPNLIYLQATAMTEPLYLGLFVWAAVFFAESFGAETAGAAEDRRGRSLLWSALCLAGAAFTRYDGWFAGAAFTGVAVLALAVRALHGRAVSWKRVMVFALICAAAPALWMVWNYSVFGNPLEFATGPYSARAIAERTSDPNFPHHPGYHEPLLAERYFLKVARLNMAAGHWEKLWLPAAMAGALGLLVFAPRLWPWLLLWLPLPFYAFSVAYGGVPIFMPVWYPFSYYNVRYGLQLLPGFAVFAAVLAYFAARMLDSRRSAVAVATVASMVVAGSYVAAWSESPICVREARVNSSNRIRFERKLAASLEQLPECATLLMYTGDHGGALQRAGIPLRRTVNETVEFFWDAGLRKPFPVADYVIAIEGDPVGAAAVRYRKQLTVEDYVSSPGQSHAIVYLRRPIGAEKAALVVKSSHPAHE
jgi:hypothetical protein